MSIQIKQGDSVAYDVKRADGLPFNENWEASWALVKRLGTEAALTGTLTLNETNTSFGLRILPSQTEDLLLGSYTLVIEISNSTINFNREVHESFVVFKQGIPAP